MTEFQIAIVALAAVVGAVGAAHTLFIVEKIRVLRNEDKRDQEAHEIRVLGGVYLR